MRKGNSVYLSHILDSIERIEEYTEGYGKRRFFVQQSSSRWDDKAH